MGFLKILKAGLYWLSLICPLIDAVNGVKKGYDAGAAEALWKKNNADKKAFYESFYEEVEDIEERKE